MSTKQVALTQASAIEFQLFGRHLESGIDRVSRRIDIFLPINFNRNRIFELNLPLLPLELHDNRKSVAQNDFFLAV